MWPRGVRITMPSPWPTSNIVIVRRPSGSRSVVASTPMTARALGRRRCARAPQHPRRGNWRSRRRRRIAIAGGGATRTCAPGSEATAPTTCRIASTSQVAIVAAARPSTGICAHDQRCDPREHSGDVAGTTIALASTAYGATSPNVAALSGQTPIWVATVSASASRTRSGSGQRSSARPSGLANSRIAPTHENDSANETELTEAGQAMATTSAASANAFHDASRAPQARANSATDTITAARCDGRCAPLSQAYATTHGIAASDAATRGMAHSRKAPNTRPAITPRWSPAVTSTCTVPVAWNSSRTSAGSVPRSPQSAPATTVASGSRSASRSRADNSARSRAGHVRASRGSGGARATTRSAISSPASPSARAIARRDGSPGLRASSNGMSRPRSTRRSPGAAHAPCKCAWTTLPPSSANANDAPAASARTSPAIVPAKRAVRDSSDTIAGCPNLAANSRPANAMHAATRAWRKASAPSAATAVHTARPCASATTAPTNATVSDRTRKRAMPAFHDGRHLRLVRATPGAMAERPHEAIQVRGIAELKAGDRSDEVLRNPYASSTLLPCTHSSSERVATSAAAMTNDDGAFLAVSIQCQ